MKLLSIIIAVFVWLVAFDRCHAQEVSDLQSLRKQVEELQQTVKTLQNQVQTQKDVMSDHGIQPKGSFTNTPEWKAMQGDVNEALNASRQKRANTFNPSMSVAVDMISSYSRNTGVDFLPRGIELMLQSNVDEWAHAYAVFNAGSELDVASRTDPFRRSPGGVQLGLEEAAISTTSLPGGIKIKGGQFFADFSSLGKVHPHDRPFVDGPRSVDTIIGGETQARGFEMNWLAPMNHYLRLTAGMVDGIGAEPASSNQVTLPDGTTKLAFNSTDYRSFSDLMYYIRGATIFEWSRSVNLHLGADYARNYQSERRQLASADFKFDWKPDPKKKDLLTWGGEALYSRTEGNLPVDSFLTTGAPFSTVAHANSLGAYTFFQYRIGQYWEPGVRFDVTLPQSFELRDQDGDGIAQDLSKIQDRFYTYSTYLTFRPSEFQFLRLQLSYLDAQNDVSRGGGNVVGNKSDIQAYLQWTIMLGDHRHSFNP